MTGNEKYLSIVCRTVEHCIALEDLHCVGSGHIVANRAFHLANQYERIAFVVKHQFG